MDYKGFLKLVKTRRSIRKFKTDPIPDEYVEKIIEAARYAPSGFNSQPWQFIVVRDKGTKDKIFDILKDYSLYSRKVELTRDEDLRVSGVSDPAYEPGYINAPVLIILCGDPRTREAYPLLTSLSRADSLFISSLASALLYMHLSATTLGLGSSWISATGHPFVQCLLKALLGIPEKLEIYDTIAVGYPAHQPKSRLLKEKTELVHYERYNGDKYQSNEELRDFIIRLRKERAKID